ncbi:unnamed protein product, partial [Nesidiocoris tenuis]
INRLPEFLSMNEPCQGSQSSSGPAQPSGLLLFDTAPPTGGKEPGMKKIRFFLRRYYMARPSDKRTMNSTHFMSPEKGHWPRHYNRSI